jgi:hypothetical protein
MTTALAIMNIVLGVVYFQYGTLTVAEMVRSRSTRGFSHFGAAWIAMAFTCGPHHFVHGAHLAFEGRTAGFLDVVAVAIGLPAGIIWFVLRVEAFRGGQGDRLIKGNPLWIIALPTLAGIYVTALVMASTDVVTSNYTIDSGVIANVLLIGLYGAIGYFLIRTQIANRRALGGWSVSGLALSIVFPTCALMHAMYAYYTFEGVYQFDTHAFWIDWIAVPAAVYFLWVVRALYKGSFRDWNGAPGRDRQLATEPVGAEAS